MAMLTRPTNIKIFGSAALAAELTDFGGSTPSTDINTILNSVAAERGWGTVGANGFPPMEWFNALGYALSYYSAYIMQSGIPAWTSLQNYYVNSYAVGSDGKLYRSKTGINGTPNVGNNPVGDTTNWESASDMAGAIHNATAKTTINGADELGIWDVLSGTLKKITAGNLKECTLQTDIASAATTSIGTTAAGDTVHITGTTTITSFGTSTSANGLLRIVIFDGALTLTHNATSLILPTGANITTAAGDSAEFVCENTALGYWRCTGYQRKDGTPLAVLNGVTQAASDNSQKLATTGYVNARVPYPYSASNANEADISTVEGIRYESASFATTAGFVIGNASCAINHQVATTNGIYMRAQVVRVSDGVVLGSFANGLDNGNMAGTFMNLRVDFAVGGIPIGTVCKIRISYWKGNTSGPTLPRFQYCQWIS